MSNPTPDHIEILITRIGDAIERSSHEEEEKLVARNALALLQIGLMDLNRIANALENITDVLENLVYIQQHPQFVHNSQNKD